MGYHNVAFHKARIQDLRSLIADESVDVIVSNCVLNLVPHGYRSQLYDEMHRVLRPSGRAVVSDIVSNEDVPAALQDDPELWSGCVSGALREDRFMAAFEDAEFDSIQVLSRACKPWRVVEGIEFRSVTVEATRLT